MIKIQYIGKEHLEAATKLFIKEFNKEPWNDSWEEERAYNRLNDLYEHPRFIGLVCLLNEQVVGIVMGYLEYWYEGYNYNLKEIFIDTNIQGKGIGSRLLEALEEELAYKEVKGIELFTLNLDKTIGFYKKNQYEVMNHLTMMEKNIKK